MVDKLRWTARVNLLYLGMLRKTRHWSFISWTLDVRSVPSHWEGIGGRNGVREGSKVTDSSGAA